MAYGLLGTGGRMGEGHASDLPLALLIPLPRHARHVDRYCPGVQWPVRAYCALLAHLCRPWADCVR